MPKSLIQLLGIKGTSIICRESALVLLIKTASLLRNYLELPEFHKRFSGTFEHGLCYKICLNIEYLLFLKYRIKMLQFEKLRINQ